MFLQKDGHSDFKQKETMYLDFKKFKIVLFLCVSFRLRGGWLGEPKSEHCSDLESGTEIWTLPYVFGSGWNKLFLVGRE